MCIVMKTEYKSEIEVSADLLGYLSNIEDEDDALTFARIYIDAMQNACYHSLNTEQIYKHIREVDLRFGSRVRVMHDVTP